MPNCQCQKPMTNPHGNCAYCGHPIENWAWNKEGKMETVSAHEAARVVTTCWHCKQEIVGDHNWYTPDGLRPEPVHDECGQLLHAQKVEACKEVMKLKYAQPGYAFIPEPTGEVLTIDQIVPASQWQALAQRCEELGDAFGAKWWKEKADNFARDVEKAKELFSHLDTPCEDSHIRSRRLRIFTLHRDAFLKLVSASIVFKCDCLPYSVFPQLPQDAEIEDVRWDEWRREFIMRVWSSEYPTVPDGEHIPVEPENLREVKTFNMKEFPRLEVRKSSPRPGDLITLRCQEKHEEALLQALKSIAPSVPGVAFLVLPEGVSIEKGSQ